MKKQTSKVTPNTPKPASKKAAIIAMLKAEGGATINELQKATGWQPHSVRGAIVHLKNKDKLPVTNTVVDGTRRYQIVKLDVQA